MSERARTAEAVIFDIDGTLLQTDSFWLEIGRRAVATVFERHGIQRDLPANEKILQAIGQPAAEFWESVLPAETHFVASEVEDESRRLEDLAFTDGLASMYPGARELLVDLSHNGRQLALASNCGQRYLDRFLEVFELQAVIDECRCAESAGISSKTDMVRDILRSFGTRSAVLVGDRDSDRRAARENGIPFVRFTGGFGTVSPEPGETLAISYGELRAILGASGD